MNLQDILLKIQFATNKAHSGRRLTPEYYNVLLEDASSKKFYDEWEVLTMLAAKAGGVVQEAMVADTPLNRFKLPVNLPYTDALGETALPANFFHSFGMYAAFKGAMRKIDIVSESVLNDYLTSLAMPSLEYSPKAVRLANSLKVYPFDVGKAPNAIRLTYMRRPTKPYYDFCFRTDNPIPIYMPVGSYILVTATTNLYNSLNQIIARNVSHPYFSTTDPIPYDPNPARNLTRYDSRTVELDWNEEQHPAIVSYILELMGVNLGNEQVQGLGKEGQQQ